MFSKISKPALRLKRPMFVALSVGFLSIIVALAVFNRFSQFNIQAQTLSSTFLDTWNGDPSAPKPLGGVFAPANWDIQIDDPSNNFWEQMELKAVNAQHQTNCGNPFHDGSGWHTFDGAYENVVYQCKNHVMTFLGQGGYAAVYMTPNQLLDLRSDTAVVRFDVSTLQPQSRDWLDLWISPWEDALVTPLEAGADNYQGPPKNAIHIKMVGSGTRGGFTTSIIRDYETTNLTRKTKETMISPLTPCTGPTDPSTTCGPSAKNRQTVEIILSRNHIKVWMPDYNVVWQDDDITLGLNWNLATVQWGHHRYNAADAKGCTDPVAGQDCANTWHWDNHTIDPAVPFTMVKANKRRVTPSDTTITLASPAPADAHLRFSATGTVEVSYDGGPFQFAQRRDGANQAISSGYGHRPHLPSSYWTPIPEGTRTATFRFSPDAGWGGPFQAKDFGVWTLEASAIASPSPSPPPLPPCELTSASWNTNAVTEGETVNLTVNGTTGCDNKEITFELRENDFLLEGFGDDPVTTNPPNVIFYGAQAVSTWITEYQEDGAGGAFDPPEYFFNATLVEDPTQTLRSADPLLEVNQLPVGGPPPPVGSGTAFLATWDGDPAAPRPLAGTFTPDDWDIAVSSRDRETWDLLSPAIAHHQANCGNPFHDGSGNHLNVDYESAVYQCANHMMTALDERGYALAVLTPNRLVDFSAGTGLVRFDVSTLDNGVRDWIDVWVTPWDDNMQLPLEERFPDLQGVPRRAVQLRMRADEGGTDNQFELAVWDNYERVMDFTGFNNRGWETVLTPCSGPNDPSTTCGPSAKNRQTIEILISQTHVKVWMPNYGLVMVDHDIPALDWSEGVVQWIHHSYNPHKSIGSDSNSPNTWHWDNFTIDPTVPFTIIHADKRRVFGYGSAGPEAVTFDAPAPAGSFLRFSAVGSVELSYDGGNSWEDAHRQDGSEQVKGDHGAAVHSSYWTPIPEGTRTVMVRLGPDGSWDRELQAKDFAVWTLDASAIASPSPSPSPLPPCELTSASWNTNAVTEGETVNLTVNGTSNCDNKEITFELRENDSLLEGFGDDPVTTNPPNVIFYGAQAVSTWITEYQEDGAGGVFDPPEYFFNATLVEDPTQTLRSADPLLEVNQLPVGGPPPPECLTYSPVMDGSEEVPPNISGATGQGTIEVNTTNNTLTYNISFSDFTSSETGAHIHGFAPLGTTAGILHTLPAGSPKVGVWNYDQSQEASILGGLAYINIHSTDFPAGEIRGQIENGIDCPTPPSPSPSPPTASPIASPTPALTPSPTPSPPSAGSRINWLGQDWYLHGVNMPWFQWPCDFGGCGGGSTRISNPTIKDQIAQRFSQLKEANIHVVRWWTFEGNAAQVQRDASNMPLQLDPQVYIDFDAALDLAQTYDLYYQFTLFSQPDAIPLSWMTDPAQRTALVNSLRPLFARYKDNPRMMTWEVFNEPDWDINSNIVDLASIQALVREIATAVHEESNSMVTVGAARIDYLPRWVGLGLDYYDAHWYDPMSKSSNCARCTDYAALKALHNLDAPLVIGEFFPNAGTPDALQRLEDWYAKGYAGAYGWSLFPEKTNDNFQVDIDAAKTFGGKYSDIGPRAPEAPTPSPSPIPTVIDIVPGWNQIKWPLEKSLDAASIDNDLEAKCGTTNATLVLFKSGLYLPFVKNFTTFNFRVNPDDTLWINSDRACQWSP